MTQSPPISPLQTALSHRCPACGKGKLYRRILVLRDHCEQCNLSYAEHDVGDGAAFFAITLLGFIVTGFAMALEIIYRIPYWQNGLWSLIVLLALMPPTLRFFKSYLFALKYQLQQKDAS